MKGQNMEFTIEREARLDAKTVSEQRIVEYFYRGSMNVTPLAGNGKQTLEQNIREFEQWARSQN